MGRGGGAPCPTGEAVRNRHAGSKRSGTIYLSKPWTPSIHFCHKWAPHRTTNTSEKRRARQSLRPPQPSPMRLARHFVELRAWCNQCLLGRRQSDVIRPGIVGCEGLRPYSGHPDLRALRDEPKQALLNALCSCLLWEIYNL